MQALRWGQKSQKDKIKKEEQMKPQDRQAVIRSLKGAGQIALSGFKSVAKTVLDGGRFAMSNSNSQRPRYSSPSLHKIKPSKPSSRLSMPKTMTKNISMPKLKPKPTQNMLSPSFKSLPRDIRDTLNREAIAAGKQPRW